MPACSKPQRPCGGHIQEVNFMAREISVNVSLTNAAVNAVFGRPVKSRGMLPSKGGTVLVKRLRGGCWTVTGEGKARVAAAVKTLKAGMTAKPVKPSVAKPASKVVLASDFHGTQLTVSRVGDTGNFLGTIKGQRVTVTGTDADDVLARLVKACPQVKQTVKQDRFQGHEIRIVKTTREGRESFFGATTVHGLRVMATGGTQREVYKALVSALSPHRHNSDSRGYSAVVEPGTLRHWDDSAAKALFNGLGL